jgi:AraC family transcriptional regulator of adaptative response/methylated-DNA-[protein]-cysteine methyltransferase
MTPGQYGAGGAGLVVQYDTFLGPFGWMLVAATAKGVCAVQFGEDEWALEQSLEAELPKAERRKRGAADVRFEEYRKEVLRRVAGAGPVKELPLDVQATSFQMQVWKRLQAIPLGETRSYAQVAEDIGAPKAARAVARACATNPVAILIPCHRVVRNDGAPGGYRYGGDRKRALLKNEREAVGG